MCTSWARGPGPRTSNSEMLASVTLAMLRSASLVKKPCMYAPTNQHSATQSRPDSTHHPTHRPSQTLPAPVTPGFNAPPHPQVFTNPAHPSHRPDSTHHPTHRPCQTQPTPVTARIQRPPHPPAFPNPNPPSHARIQRTTPPTGLHNPCPPQSRPDSTPHPTGLPKPKPCPPQSPPGFNALPALGGW